MNLSKTQSAMDLNHSVQIMQRILFLGNRLKAHTVSSEDVASAPPDPRHVFKAEKSGIHSQARATFPNATNITWTNPGQKRDCEATAHECPAHGKLCHSLLNHNKYFPHHQEAGM